MDIDGIRWERRGGDERRPAGAFMILLLFLSAAFFSACGKGEGESGAPPSSRPAPKGYNVLLISLDTLRADHLHCYGYPREVSPRMDRFAGRAVVFEHALSHAPWTTPSHAAMLTSIYPSALGIRRYPKVGRIADPVETMAEYFRSFGYRTHAVTEGGMVHARFGFDQGFEKYFQSSKHVDQGVRETLKWLEAHKKERFFFFFHTYDIHRYDPPEKYRTLFVKPGPHRLAGDEALAQKVQLLENEEFLRALNGEDLQYLVDLYDASIRWVDDQVGLLLEYLKREGLLKRTVVVITSDHGEEFLERGRTGHGYSNHVEQIHVPLIIHHPEARPGRRKTLFRHIDLLPTIAESVGLPARREWLGASLYPSLVGGDGEAPSRQRLDYCECGHTDERSVESLKWKLIYDQGTNRLELYDLAADPKERHPVTGKHEDVVRRLLKVLERIKGQNEALQRRLASGMKKGEEALPPELADQLKKLGYAK